MNLEKKQGRASINMKNLKRIINLIRDLIIVNTGNASGKSFRK